MSKLKGFTPTFWVANVLELFERFAYYGSKAVLAVYIAEKVGLGPEKAGFLVGSVFNFLLYFLPAATGTIVDRFGFKRSLLACFAIFSVGYFLIGFGGLPQGQDLVRAVGGPTRYMIAALVITAIGGSLIKPCIVGTVARTTTESTKAFGYSIYYTLVNFGGFFGPILASLVRENYGIAYVLIMASAVSFVLIVATLVFYREPARPEDAPPVGSFWLVIGRMLLLLFSPLIFVGGWLLSIALGGAGKSSAPKVRAFVVGLGARVKFVSFLLIFSGFWAMFWHIFYALPFYARDVVGLERFELIETVDALTIILLTVPTAALAKRLSPFGAMCLGFVVSTVSWFLMGSIATLAVAVVAIVVFAIGEAIQAPRYYEYVADLAPKDQVGTYMGFAFLPVAIGTFIAGATSGPLVARYVGVREGDVFVPGPDFANASHMWFWVGGIGVVSTVAMLLYDRFVARRPQTA